MRYLAGLILQVRGFPRFRHRIRGEKQLQKPRRTENLQFHQLDIPETTHLPLPTKFHGQRTNRYKSISGRAPENFALLNH